jgi:hypothetical protein
MLRSPCSPSEPGFRAPQDGEHQILGREQHRRTTDHQTDDHRRATDLAVGDSNPRRSSLKERELSSCSPGLTLVFGSSSAGVGARRVKAAGSRRGRRPPAKRPEGLDADAARCRLGRRRGRRWLSSWSCVGVVGRVGIQGRCPGRGRPTWGCQSSLRRARHGAVRLDGRSGSIRRGDHASLGVMTCTTRADRCWRAVHAARRRM